MPVAITSPLEELPRMSSGETRDQNAGKKLDIRERLGHNTAIVA
jgi:hypothetical protein